MAKAELHGTSRDYTDEEIRSFVRDLESLRGGDLTVSLLVGCGQRAIAPLREFLLYGKPRGVFQPRQKAVQALGELGARDVLMEYLSQEREIADAVVRFGEEAVENSAARELAHWRTDEVFEFLVNLARRRTLAGVVDALAEFERLEAARLFVHALEDDVCRPAAEAALRRIASQVKPVLVQAARRDPNVEVERPSELQRRRRVLSILSDLRLSVDEWEGLRPLLEDQDIQIVTSVARLAMDTAPCAEKGQAAALLIRSLSSSPWFQQIQIQECLNEHYSDARDLIEGEIARRKEKPDREQAADQVLRILLAVRLKQKDTPRVAKE